MMQRIMRYRAATSTAALVKAGLVFGLSISAIAVVVTGAVFTDSQTVGGNSFTTGTVDLSATPASAAVTFSGMVPGDATTGPITVSNDGTVQYRYSVTSTATDADAKDLAAQLDMTIKTGVTDCSNAGFGDDGQVLYGPDDFGSVGGIDVIGDPSQGADPGDRVLAAADSEVLCIHVALPSGTSAAYEGAATTGTFTFDAEQVASNP